MLALIVLELDSSYGSTRSLHGVMRREKREYLGQMVQNIAADRLARCSGYPQTALGWDTCQLPVPRCLLTCSQHLVPTCLGPPARSLPRYLGPELRSEHIQSVKETHLLSETTGLGLRVCATPAQILSDLVLLCYMLKQPPPLHQCTVQLCISQAVQKWSNLLQPFSKSPQHII